MNKQRIREEIRRLVEMYAALDAAEQEQFVPEKTFLPASKKVTGAREMNAMIDAALDCRLTAWRFNRKFEQRLAEFAGVNHVLTVNSGSSANLIAFSTLTSPVLGKRAILPGDEVIAVAAAFPTTVNPIIQYGCIPVFIDIELGTYNIDVSAIEAAITHKTKAIMIAHTLGNPFNLEVVVGLCKKYNLWLIEDCCDALGSIYKGKMVGTFGDLATLSFYPAHHITMGEGGAVLTNNSDLKRIAESIRDWGRDCYCAPGKDNTCGRRFSQRFESLPEGYDHKYIYTHAGYNLKVTEMQAACGLAQLERLPQFIERRKANFAFLRARLESCEKFMILPEATPGSDPSWFGFPLTIRESARVKRVDLITYLEQHNIGTRLLFAGNLIRQPYMCDKAYRCPGELRNTDFVMNQTFWVGVHPALNEEMLKFIAAKINEFFGIRS